MCDGTGLTPQLKSGGGGAGGFGGARAPIVTVRQLQRPEFQKDFTIIDVREAIETADNTNNNNNNDSTENKSNNESTDDIFTKKFKDCNNVKVPMGQLLASFWQNTDDFKKIMNERPKIGLVCGSGARAQIAADDLVLKTNYDVYNVKGGLKAMNQRIYTDDDWCAILSYLNNDPEKVGIALNLCNAAAAKGKSVTLVLMHEAVYLGTKRYFEAAASNNNDDDAANTGSDNNNDNTWELPAQVELPKPFKQWRTLYESLIAKSGQILVCTSCLKKRGISPKDDLLEPALSIRGPDIVDITLDAGFVMQFM